MKAQKLLAIITLLLSSVTDSVLAYAEEAPNPGEVSIRGFTYRGSGCLPGSANYVLSPDARAFTLLFDRYTTEAGGENSEVGQRSCVVDVALNIPAGWSYTLFAVDYRGFADLDAGAMAVQNSCYSFVSNPAEHFVGEQKLQGPYSSGFAFRNQIPIEKFAWSSCSASTDTLRIKTSIRVEGDLDRHALMTVDSMDGELKQQYAIQWKRCGGPAPELADVFRFIKNGEGVNFYHTTNPNEVGQGGYRNQKKVFRVYKTQAASPALIPLYLCVSAQGWLDQSLSTDKKCGAAPGYDPMNRHAEGTLGFIQSASAPGHVALYEITVKKGAGRVPGRNGDGDKGWGVYIGTDQNEAQSLGFKGVPRVIGYVAPTN